MLSTQTLRNKYKKGGGVKSGRPRKKENYQAKQKRLRLEEAAAREAQRLDGRDNDEELPQDFGKNLSHWQKEAIIKIKNNDPAYEYKQFQLHFNGGRHHFTSDSEWKILGRYIAQNEYLQDMLIETGFPDRSYTLVDSAMSAFFGELNRSAQLRRVELKGCACTADGFRSMAPFLNNSPQLKTLKFGLNECIGKQCFNELMRLLDGKSIESLDFEKCSKLDDTVHWNIANLVICYPLICMSAS